MFQRGLGNHLREKLASHENIAKRHDLVLLSHDVLRFFRKEIFRQKINSGCIEQETGRAIVQLAYAIEQTNMQSRYQSMCRKSDILTMH